MKSKRVRALLCLLAALAVTAGMLAGCSSGSYLDAGAASSAAEYVAGYGERNSFEFGMETADTAAMVKSEAEAPDVSAPVSYERKIIRTMELSMETLEFDTLLDSINEEVARVGGYVESSSVNGAGINVRRSSRSGSIVARIPQEKLDDFLSVVGTLGNITYQSEQSEDVTLRYVDIDSHKRSLETEQERLFALLEQAQDLDSIIKLEERLSQVRYQLESYASQLRAIDSQVDYSTVSISLYEVLRISDPEPVGMGERISTGFAQTLYDISQGAQDLAVWFVVNLPYLVIWAILFALLILLIRWIAKRTNRPRARRWTAAPQQPESAASKASGQSADETSEK